MGSIPWNRDDYMRARGWWGRLGIALVIAGFVFTGADWVMHWVTPAPMWVLIVLAGVYCRWHLRHLEANGALEILGVERELWVSQLATELDISPSRARALAERLKRTRRGIMVKRGEGGTPGRGGDVDLQICTTERAVTERY